MNVKVSDLIGPAFDWAVAKCEGKVEQGVYGTPQLWNTGLHLHYCDVFLGSSYSPSTDWAQGGPIIEREKIGIDYYHIPPTPPVWISGIAGTMSTKEGKTPLIAAMRCYVASKLGNEVDIPEELL